MLFWVLWIVLMVLWFMASNAQRRWQERVDARLDRLEKNAGLANTDEQNTPE